MSDVINIETARPKLCNLNSYTYLPLTAKQFEEMTNELMNHVNQLTAPEAMDAKFFALVLIRAIHGMDAKNAKVRKQEIFESCVVRLSRNLTFNIGQEIEKEMNPAKTEPRAPAPDVLPDEVVTPVEAPPATA